MKLTLGKAVLLSLATLAFSPVTAYAEQCPDASTISFDNNTKQYETTDSDWFAYSASESGDVNLKLDNTYITTWQDKEMAQCSYNNNAVFFYKTALHIVPDIVPGNDFWKDDGRDLFCTSENVCEFKVTDPSTDNPYKVNQWARTMTNRVSDIQTAYNAYLKLPTKDTFQHYQEVGEYAFKVQGYCYKDLPGSAICHIPDLPHYPV